MGQVCCTSSEDRAKFEADGTSEPKLMFECGVQTTPLPSELPVSDQQHAVPACPAVVAVQEPTVATQEKRATGEEEPSAQKGDDQCNPSGLTQADIHAAHNGWVSAIAPGLTYADIHAVQKSWVSATAIGVETVGILLFSNIFKLAPQTLHLFSFKDTPDLYESDKLKRHANKVVGTVGVAVAGLTDLDNLVPLLQSLGQRHVPYGVLPSHYDVIGQALIATLKTGLGDAFTPSLEESWVKVYTLVAKTMQRDSYPVATASVDAKKASKKKGDDNGKTKRDDTKRKTMTPFKKKTDDRRKSGDLGKKEAHQKDSQEKVPKEKPADMESTGDGVSTSGAMSTTGAMSSSGDVDMETKRIALAAVWKKMSAQDKKQKGEALLAAAKKGNTSEIESLLNQGASPNCVTNEGWSALHSAAQGGKRDMLDILLSYGADPTLQIKLGDWGFTPLHLAAREGHKEIVRALVKADKKGIALRTKNLQGKLPSDLARESIANYLIKKMGDK